MKILVYFYLIWCVFFSFLEAGYHIPLAGPLALLDEAIAIILLVHLGAASLAEGRWIVPPSPVTGPLAGILVLALLSWIVNGSSTVNGLQFVFSIVKPIILFYWIISFVRDSSVERWMMGFLVVMILAQLPFIAYGLLTRGVEYTGDNVKGMVNTSTTVALLMWLGTLGALGAYMVSRKARWILAGVLCTALLALTSTKVVAAFLPVAAVILLRKEFRVSVGRIAALAVVGGGILFYLSFKTEKVWMDVESAGRMQIEDYDLTAAVVASEKVQGYYSVLFELPDEIVTPLLGAGPGEYGSYTAMLKRTPLANKYIMYYDDQFRNTGIMMYRSSGLISIYGDLGIVAFILWMVIYFRLFRHLMQRWVGQDRLRLTAVSFVVSSAGFLVLWESIFMNVFEGNVFLLNFFWILAGGVFAAQRTRAGIPENERAGNGTANGLVAQHS